ncbi:PREDICTED: probable cytochrome P450 6d5 [Drosophila arizonae]|uniref:Probable cytochrome P450 6d5 n=1 Tax=Drosophila arizonae TaxID=7263 RepID=A0ABM1NMX6_DROAR|nr:PREDICTED: probable cytochrome P450 6d5 [Drosophila arizonae]
MSAAIYLLGVIGVLLYTYLKWTFSFWERKGFPCNRGSIPFGALDSVRRNKRSFGLAIYDMYLSSKKPFIGIYLTLRPALLVRDAQLAYDMLVKDFASFHDRGIYVDEKHDALSANLFSMEGKSWRTMRTKMSPSFTSGKLKAMFSTSEDVADKMVAHLNKNLQQSGASEIDMKNLMACYGIDIIASTILGLDVDSFTEPENELRRISKKVTDNKAENILRGTTLFLYPGLEKLFVRLGWRSPGQRDMQSLVHHTIMLREKTNVERRDLMQLLLQLRNTGQVNNDDGIWSAEATVNSVKTLSKDNVAAQLFLFFVAGYETTASTIAFTLYELAQNPDVLAKLLDDINQTLAKHNGELNYDSIQDMKYLELCVMETTRKYPALPILNRMCNQDYPLPNSNLVLKKGTEIIISLLGMQRDEEYFPDPLRYQPERFTEEHRNYTPAAYMPFGVGPRQCIAARMGKLNVKIALTKILTNFKVESQEKREIEFTVHGVPLLPKGGVPVRLSKKQ